MKEGRKDYMKEGRHKRTAANPLLWMVPSPPTTKTKSPYLLTEAVRLLKSMAIDFVMEAGVGATVLLRNETPPGHSFLRLGGWFSCGRGCLGGLLVVEEKRTNRSTNRRSFSATSTKCLARAGITGAVCAGEQRRPEGKSH
jgi:hypothetical protein